MIADFIGGCGTGRLYCSLDYDGTIYPCVFITTIGPENIRKDSLLKVWHESKEFREIREREKF